MTVLARKYRAGGYFAPFPVWMSGLMKLSVRERDFSQLSRVESGCRRGWRKKTNQLTNFWFAGRHRGAGVDAAKQRGGGFWG